MIKVTYDQDGKHSLAPGRKIRIETEDGGACYSEYTGPDPCTVLIIVDESQHNRAYLYGGVDITIEEVE